MAAVLVSGLALGLSAIGLVIMLRSNLTSNISTAVELRAEDVASSLRDAPEIPFSIDSDEDGFIQVIDDSGTVIASSTNALGPQPLVEIAAGAFVTVDLDLAESGPYRVFAEAGSVADRKVTIVVGRSLEAIEESTGTLARLLALGVPVLVLIIGLTTYLLVGRALRPVEVLRGEVSSITSEGLDRRVPTVSGDDEIARLSVTLNEMLERLDASQKRQRRFISDASHELRSPVTVIRNAAETALVHRDSTDVTQLASDVLAEDLRLQKLVDDLLLLARSDEGDAPEYREVDIDDLVLEHVSRLASTDVRIDTAHVSGARVRGEPAYLRGMVSNLLDNATRHARSTVRVTVLETTAAAVVTIEDDGDGIPIEARAKVFERFARLDEARSRDRGGAGLGLAIVEQVVAKHGGTVVIKDSSLGGALFEVSLPRHP